MTALANKVLKEAYQVLSNKKKLRINYAFLAWLNEIQNFPTDGASIKFALAIINSLPPWKKVSGACDKDLFFGFVYFK